MLISVEEAHGPATDARQPQERHACHEGKARRCSGRPSRRDRRAGRENRCPTPNQERPFGRRARSRQQRGLIFQRHVETATGTALIPGLFAQFTLKLGSGKMDRERIEGGLKKATGTVKEKAGEVLGDRHLENEGTAEKTEGNVRSAVGKVKDAARDIFKK